MLDVWQARLDCPAWPAADALPHAERQRASRMSQPRVCRRWVAARWALRGVLARYLEQDPVEVELDFGERGKPQLAVPESLLRFNLSHSGELALIAVAESREVGVDVQKIGSRHPAGYYSEWARREAIAKCHGVGLWAELPQSEVAVAELEVDPGYAAALAVAGAEMPAVRRFEAEPDDLAGSVAPPQ